MRFSLTSMFGYLSLFCMAMALTQLHPLVGFCLFVAALYAVSIMVSAERWECFFACVILSMAVYCLFGALLIEFTAPDPFPGNISIERDREIWRNKQFAVVQSSMIPIASCVGAVIWGFLDSRKSNLEQRTGNWYLREAMIMVVAGCSVLLFFLFYPAIGLEKTLRHGSQMMFIWQHQEPFDYPANADRWLAMQWNEKYFSVSVPLLVAAAAVSVGSTVWVFKVLKPRFLSRLMTD